MGRPGAAWNTDGLTWPSESATHIHTPAHTGEGYAADAAIAEIRGLRPGSVETEAQAAFVAELAAAASAAPAAAANERVLS